MAHYRVMNAIQFISQKMRLWYGSYSAAARAMNMIPKRFREVRWLKKPTTPTAKRIVVEYKLRFLQRLLLELRKNGGVQNWQIQDALKRMNREKL